MKRFLLSLLISSVLFIVGDSPVFAQTTGCLYNGNIYYTPDGTSGGFPNYKKSPFIAVGSAFCVVNIGGTCRVDKKSSQQGTKRTFTFVQCPIDDYIPVLVLIVGGIGLYKLRRQPIKNLL